jgi:hypothetical protein
MTKLLSDRVKKTPAGDSPADRYSFLRLADAEPSLGVPDTDTYILYGDVDGLRYWAQPNPGPLITDTSLTGNGTVSSVLSVEKLATPVNISLSGEISGTVSFDGSSDVQIATIPDNVVAVTKSLTLTQNWQDTGISGTDLETGTHFVQLYTNNAVMDGDAIREYHSGTMSWLSDEVSQSSSPADEIMLHRTGAGGTGSVFLRTFRSAADVLKLQITSTYTTTSSANYIFKFRKMI